MLFEVQGKLSHRPHWTASEHSLFFKQVIWKVEFQSKILFLNEYIWNVNFSKFYFLGGEKNIKV